MEDIRKEVISLDDSALRQQLLEAEIAIGPIVTSTRPIFEKKLIEFKSRQKGLCPSFGEMTHAAGSDDNASARHVLPSSQTSTPKRTNSDSYFVVCIPLADCKTTDTDFETPSKAESHIFEDQKEALRLLKKNPGARFKVFRSREDAESFAGQKENLSTPRSVEPECKGRKVTLPQPAQDSPNQYHSIKPQQYVALRKAIISQDKEKFKELVWSNPRYLISTGDTPTILQEGSRYNAVHICAQKNLPEMCSLVLETLQDPEFIRLMYSEEPQPVLIQRMDHIVDLYINVPDKGNFETPLHFACKFGNVEMVELLVGYQMCERGSANRYGHTPEEIICSRSNASKEEQRALKEKIVALLDGSEEEVFIPVFRTEDNTSPPHIGQPWSPASSDSQSGQSFDSLKSPVDVEWSVKAFAGPMSPKEASDLYKRWKGRWSGSCMEDRGVQRSDEEKGLERIGRKLSQSAGVPWKEYWDFLDDFVDLATPEGLQKLEDYLSAKYNELLGTSPVQTESVDDVVKDLNVQFDVMDIRDTAGNGPQGELPRDDRVAVTPFEHCAQNSKFGSPKGTVEASSCKCDQDTDISGDGSKVPDDRQENASCPDNSALSTTDVDELCQTFSLLRLGEDSLTSESDVSGDKTGEAGDCGRDTRMVSKSETVEKNSPNSADPTADRLGSVNDTLSSSADDSVPENVFSSPEQDLPHVRETSSRVGGGKGIYIIGAAPSRRDMDVYRALHCISPSDKYPLVQKWKDQIEKVEDKLRLRWPTPRRQLRRSTSNPNFPSSPMISRSRVFTFSPQRIGNRDISPVQLYRPSSDPRSSSSQDRSQEVPSPPVTRLFVE